MFSNTLSVGVYPNFTPKDITVARKRIGLRILQEKNSSVPPSDAVSPKVILKKRKNDDEHVTCWVKQGKMMHIATY